MSSGGDSSLPESSAGDGASVDATGGDDGPAEASGDDMDSSGGADGAGDDGGVDAGLDAGTDSGPVDSGFDSGTDSGPRDAGNDTGITDAGHCDANAAVAIPATGSDNFLPVPNAHWVAAGNADINTTTSGWATLTADMNSQAGAVWWNASYTFDSFNVTFTFEIQNKASGADGMGFGWVPGSDVSVAGNSGGGYGVVGLSGWGVIIDTFQNTGEPAAPFLTVVDGAGDQLTHVTLGTVRDGNAHKMQILLQNAAVTVWVDNVQVLAQFALPSYVPFTGHWGFVGATGQSSETHKVTGISMLFPSGQGCVQ